jgi:5-methylcytosine-specific restriction endonuclease McrA
MNLSHVSNHELLSGVRSLVGEERELTAKLVAYLGEVEERHLHLEAGFPSMFAFCVKELGMSENEAFRRIAAARLGRRFPVIHSLLVSGAVHLTALELLRDRLTEQNHVALLEAVSGKSKAQIVALLAGRFPRPDVPTTIRKLPEPPANGGSSTSSTTSANAGGSTFALGASPSEGAPQPARGSIEPLSAARYCVEFTASAELREKLELCRDLMSHANPSRELGVVVERAVDLLLADLEKKRLARTKRPRPTARSRGAKPGRVTSEVRRQVFEHDGLQCTYVSPEGRRCEARAFLELDHVVPQACRGTDDAENLRVFCGPHNRFAAEQVFGREHIDRRRDFVRTKRRESRERESDKLLAPGARPSSTIVRIRSALVGLGFGSAEVREAVARVESLHANVEALPIEQTLREALLAATDYHGR